MTSTLSETTPRRAALIAGIGYLIIFVLAIFGNFIVLNGMVAAGDAAATAANIQDAEGIFRLGLVGFMIVFIADVVVAWALYIVFRSLSRDLSLLTAWFRLVYTVLLGVALIFFFVALDLLGSNDYLSVLDTSQRNAHALLSLDAFNYAWLIGLAAFGFHLGLLGYLVLRSGYVTRILGYVLMIAGTAYVFDTAAHALLANYTDFENLFLAIVAIPSVIGELWFAVWLLTRGGKDQAVAAA